MNPVRFYILSVPYLNMESFTVLSRALTPPSNTSEPAIYEDQKEQQFSSRNHNYTDCCVSQNVSSSCLGFCNIQSILEGKYRVLGLIYRKLWQRTLPGYVGDFSVIYSDLWLQLLNNDREYCGAKQTFRGNEKF